MTDVMPSLHLAPDAVVVQTHDGASTVLRTPAQAQALRAILDLALNELHEQQRQREARLDRETARALNFSWRRRNLTPVGTLTPTSTTITHVEPSTGCACSCSATCGADHGPDVA